MVAIQGALDLYLKSSANLSSVSAIYPFCWFGEFLVFENAKKFAGAGFDEAIDLIEW